MIHAVAVIPCAAGAETELQLGEIRVGTSADLALAGIGSCFHFMVDAAHFVLKFLGRLSAAALLGRKEAEEAFSEKQYIVQQRHNR